LPLSSLEFVAMPAVGSVWAVVGSSKREIDLRAGLIRHQSASASADDDDDDERISALALCVLCRRLRLHSVEIRFLLT